MLDDAGWAEQRGAEASAAVEHAAAPGAQHPKSSRGLLRPGEQRGAGALFGFLTANPATFPVRTQCRLLGISPSGYHTWRRRPPSARAKGDSALSERVRAIYARSRGTYGVPRGHAGLAAQGTRVGHKRIARLICADRLAGVWCRKAFHTTLPCAFATWGAPRTWPDATTRHRPLTACGSPRSPVSPLGPGSSVCPWWWMPSAGG